MSRPTSRATLLTLSQENYIKLFNLVSGLTEAQIVKPGACENWSVKDIMAHLHAWHLMMHSWYDVGMAGKKPEIPAPQMTWKDCPKLNQQIYERYKDFETTEVLSALEKSHEHLMKLIEGHSDEELFTKKYYGWTGTTSLGAYFISATSSHYDWAYKLIKKVAVK